MVAHLVTNGGFSGGQFVRGKPAAAYGCLFVERAESGTRKILNRASSGKLSAALAETNPTTAAETSLATSRLIALV